MLSMIQSYRLPSKPQFPGVNESFGITVENLTSLRDTWLHNFNWEQEQALINQLNHYTINLPPLQIHFIHHKSAHPNSIPILLLHGWPGSFLEFIPLIQPLISDPKTPFDIIIPSLPGFAFSSSPPGNWTLDDTARLFNTLMTDILGYETYAVHGTSHGVPVGFTLYDEFNKSVRAAHFVFMPFYPVDGGWIDKNGVVLSELERFELERAEEWGREGNGYFVIQSTKPNTVGLAMYDNPVGQLAWIGEKYIDWSDPNAGNMNPSLLTTNEILRAVSLYYLTNTFNSAIYTYAQDPGAWESQYRRARTDAPMLVSFFKYNVGFWPREIMETVGNLTLYRNHEFGGNFAGLDNPAALVGDLREIAKYW
ncbi:putative epoxide hydrolase [Podospora fimiseda]|uniref:Epoxide hydrolase n=1 Tax=Podospora fimiseda TaxID=252190 RepID=A0AAN7BEB0_9PEZI|nr:putative epoxide hydrolase [Podospora fimiseda]